MKKLILLMLLIPSLSTISAQSILRLINNTNKQVFCSVAHYDSETRLWICEGWYAVEPYSQRDMDFGNYSGKVYVHGKQSTYMGLSETTWGDGYSLCVDEKNAFTIRDADNVNCDKKRSFSEKRLHDGINNWEFNPK